jgi:hypothetical protein
MCISIMLFLTRTDFFGERSLLEEELTVRWAILKFRGGIDRSRRDTEKASNEVLEEDIQPLSRYRLRREPALLLILDYTEN